MDIGKKMIFVLLIVFLSLFSTDLPAEVIPGEVTLTNQVGLYKFENSQNLEDALTFGIGLSYNITEHWGIEGSFTYIDTDVESGGNKNVSGQMFRLDGMYHLMPDKRFVPFLFSGMGFLNNLDTNGNNGEDFLFNFGAGIQYFLTQSLVLRGDIRHIYTLDENNSNFHFALGASFLPGRIARREKAPPPPPKPLPPPVEDRDSDGIPDDIDRCPDTPVNIPVDSSGCPRDRDADGVPDYLDTCADTPAGVAVNASGCPEDSDGDGIPDYRDDCPDTPHGVIADAAGCAPPAEKEEPVKFKDIYFEFKQTALTEEARETLKKNIQILKNHPEVIIRIEGHACSHGPEELNLRISQERAKVIMEYLIREGIARERLSVLGYGESRPALPEIPTPENKDSAEARANRRVHFEVITQELESKKILSKIMLRFSPYSHKKLARQI
jgi:OOP family OmpA-OmpF porin